MMKMTKAFSAISVLFLILMSCQVKDVKYYYNEGIRLEGEGKFADAGKMYTELLKLNETHFNALFNAGNLYLLQKNYKLAKQHYVRAIIQNTNYAPAYYGLGLAFFGLKDGIRGREAMRRASVFDPKLLDAWFLHAWSLYEEQKIKEALKILDAAEKGNPGSADVFFNRGWILFENGDYTNALPSLQKAAQIATNDFSITMLQARIYLKTGSVKKAAPIIRMLLKKQPDKLTTRLLKARYLFATDKKKEAMRSLTGIVREYPGSFSGRMLYAELLEKSGKLDQALRHYSAAANLDFKNPLPRLSRKRIYLLQKKKFLAGKELYALRKQFPKDKRVLKAVLSFQFNGQEYERAIRTAGILKKIDRNNPETDRILAYSLLRTDDPSIRNPKQAAKLLWDLRSQYKKDAFFLRTLLRTLKETGERRKAREVRRLLKAVVK